MATLIDYAALSARVYWDVRDPLNQNPVPTGWVPIANQSFPLSSGFTGEAYLNTSTNEIVIAFKGTDFTLDTNPTQAIADLQADGSLALGLGSQQLIDAVNFYKDVYQLTTANAAYAGASISFTGHSLGAGLASIMSVWFNKPATVFAEAPFEASAVNIDYIQSVLAALPAGDIKTALSALLTITQNPPTIPGQPTQTVSINQSEYTTRQNQVSNYYVDGELLELARTVWFNVVESANTHEIAIGGGGDIPGGTLHSMNLHAALLMEDILRQDTVALPNLLPSIFSADLYGREPNLDRRDFLTSILNDQIKLGYTATNGLLHQFALDAQKISGGLAVTNDLLNKALIAAVIEDYYFMENGFTKTFLTQGTGNLNFNLKDIGDKWNDKDAKALKQLIDAAVAIIGKTQGGQYLNGLEPSKWYVQSGTAAMNVTATGTDDTAMLGSTGNDQHTGASGSDFLYGGGGNDTLAGKGGNDILLGGSGNDTYIYNTGDGFDTILDEGGQGSIKVDGIALSGGKQYGDNRVHKDEANHHLYVQVDDKTLIIDGNILVQNYTANSGALTLTMTGPTAETYPEIQTNNTITGDTEEDLKDLLHDTESNDLINAGAGQDHVIKSHGGNDLINLGEGDDRLETNSPASGIVVANGGDGRDYLGAGAQNDVLEGGADADYLYGAGGNDLIYGSTKGDTQAFITQGNTQESTGEQGELVDAEDGDDKIFTGAGNDYIGAGAGEDLIVAGGGDDYIWGDRNTSSIGDEWKSWSVTKTIQTSAGGDIYQYQTNNLRLESDEGVGNDVIYAGKGNDVADGQRGNDVIFGEDGNDELWGGADNDVLIGGKGNDFLVGDGAADGAGNDYLDGGDGEDTIYGGEGDDILVGGKNVDILHGGKGSDTYIINKGDGIDRIFDDFKSGTVLGADKNRIRFGVDIAPADVKLGKGSLLMDLGNGDQVHIEGFDPDDAVNSVGNTLFEFADGTLLTAEELLARGFDLNGTESDDTITGTNLVDRITGLGGNDTLVGGIGNDFLEGGVGDDTLTAGDGNDIVTGGTGNDFLDGGAGDDVYMLSLGDGEDAIDDITGLNEISFGEGITTADLAVSQYQGDDGSYYLRIQYGDSGDSLAIKNGLNGSIQSFRFTDDTVIDLPELMRSAGIPFYVHGTANAETLYGSNEADTLNGNDGNDEIYGLVGDDTLLGGNGDDNLQGGIGNDLLDGGLGNDELDGGAGQDNYLMTWGMGRDTAIDGADGELNTIKLDTGISLADVSAKRLGDDLLVYFKGTNDGVLLNNYYTQSQLWSLTAAEGETTALADLVASSDPNSNQLTSVQQLIDSYQTNIKALYYQTMGNDGFKLGADGLFYKNTKEATSYSLTSYHYVNRFQTVFQESDEPEFGRATSTFVQNHTQLSYSNTLVPVYSGNGFTTAVSGSGSGGLFVPYSDSGSSQELGAMNNVVVANTGVWVFVGGTTYGSGSNSASVAYTSFSTSSYQVDATLILEKIQGGASDNVIDVYGYAVVDAGDGDDVILSRSGGSGWESTYNSQFAPNEYLLEKPNSRNIGSLLYGNAGYDVLIGSNANDTLIGGDDADSMDGGDGADTYMVLAGESGIDFIFDSGHIKNADEIQTNIYMDWYYKSIGIDNWQSRFYDPVDNEDLLPEIPPISPHDYSALAPLYDAGIVDMDVIQFGSGIDLNDLHLSWGQTGNSPYFTGQINPFSFDYETSSNGYYSALGDTVATLDISWGENQGVRVVIPLLDLNSAGTNVLYGGGTGDWWLGAGIEQFKFADGTVLSMQEMAGMAPVMPDFDAFNRQNNVIAFASGLGIQSVSYLWKREIQFGENITQSDINVSRVGADLILTHVNGIDQLRIQNWYADPNSPSFIQARFADGSIWSNEILTERGLFTPLVGTTGDDVLVAYPGYNNTILGMEGNDQLVGASNDDDLDGGLGADTMTGGYGDDWYTVDNTADSVIEELDAGYDTVLSTVSYTLAANVEDLILDGSDSISATGNELDNYLEGNVGNNALFGGDGGDVLDGGAGNDELFGEGGSDTYIASIGNDIIHEVGQSIDDVDTIYLDINPDDLVLQRSQNDLVFVYGNDSIAIGDWYGQNGKTIEQISFADGTLWDSAELEAMALGDNINHVPAIGSVISTQTATEEAAFSFTVPAAAFTDADVDDELAYSATLENGAALPSWISFDTATQTFSGTPTNDNVGNFNLTLTATDLAGAAISQTFGISIININDAPVVTTTIANTQATDGSAFNWVLPANVFSDVDLGDLLSYSITLADGSALPSWLMFNAQTQTLSGTPDSSYIGSAFTLKATATDLAGASVSTNFNLTVNAMPDQVLIGTADNDTLIGGSGNDTLDGGAGADNMSGGLGNDTYVVDNTGDLVTENTNAGTDTVQSGITYTLVANVENLTLTGTAAINATGNLLDNTLVGNTANNTLNGGIGADLMQGGLGNDIYVVDNVSDVVIENVAEGTDTVQSSISYSLGANLENLTLTGTAAISGTGNELDNTLVGNSAANTLTGDLGNDSLNGGAGADLLIGGQGNDTYTIDQLGDTITENANEGADLVNVAIGTTGGSYALGANLENATLTNTVAYTLSGNVLDNVLTGNGAANTLNGGDGNDLLRGGSGADTLNGGAGNDTVTYSLTWTGVQINLAAGTATGGQAAGDVLIGIENITGSGTDDILIGDAGNNVLDGSQGSDQLTGGLGDDTYVLDGTGDTIIENADEGIDTVKAHFTRTLGDNLENFILTGTGGQNGTGNSLNNVLTGNVANNILDGKVGADTMIGGLGNDTYYVDDLGDVVIETSILTSEIDQVQSSVSFTLGDNLEKLTLTGTDNINGTGNTLDNSMTGNSGNNQLTDDLGNDTLNGGAGADTMIGGQGNDTYVVDNESDVVTENANEGIDTVSSNVNYTLGSDLDNLTLTGFTAWYGSGNALDNVIKGNSAYNKLYGNAGDDIIDGGSGVDTMVGGTGNDTYVVDNASDIVTESVNAGVDTVKSGVSYTLSNNVENLTLLATTAINGTGNALSNFLSGNIADNTLDGIEGNDLLQGLAGADTLTDTSGNNLYDGGLDNDTLTTGTGNDLLIGGKGNDTLTTGTGVDVIAFNKGDGQDLINASVGADNTLSLGGNFAYSDLSLSKSGNDLLLNLGATDQITFKDWYVDPTNKSVINLQVIAEAVQGFSLGSADLLRDNKIENFNFADLVTAFDASGTAAGSNWQLTDAMLTAHLNAGSDTAALGGDLAYQYGMNSNLTGIGMLAAQNVINASTMGQSAQTLNNPTVWQAEVVKLA